MDEPCNFFLRWGAYKIKDIASVLSTSSLLSNELLLTGPMGVLDMHLILPSNGRCVYKFMLVLRCNDQPLHYEHNEGFLEV